MFSLSLESIESHVDLVNRMLYCRLLEPPRHRPSYFLWDRLLQVRKQLRSLYDEGFASRRKTLSVMC
jgi:hypothetical protein